LNTNKNIIIKTDTLLQYKASVSVSHLNKKYDTSIIIKDLSFSVSAGESLAIIGPSGCGKSTLLCLLSNLDTLYTGTVTYGTQGTMHNPGKVNSFLEVYGRYPRISYVMQDYGLFPWKSAEENLILPLILLDIPPQVQKNAVKEMFYELGLEGINSKYPNELSGGQRQRLALGRALISSPEILLLDEPLSSVDAITREHLQGLLLQLWKKHSFTCILVTHSVSEAIYLGHNIMVMGKNKEGESGKPQFFTMLENPCFGDENMKNTDVYIKMSQLVSEALAKSY